MNSPFVSGGATNAVRGGQSSQAVAGSSSESLGVARGGGVERERDTGEDSLVMDENVSFLEPSFRYISGICVDDKNRLCITEEDTARLYFYSVGG